MIGKITIAMYSFPTAKMVRFSLSPKITLRKEKTRKNSESKENNISLK